MYLITSHNQYNEHGVFIPTTQFYFEKIIKDMYNSCFCTLKHLFIQDYDLFDINPSQKQRKRKTVLFWKKSYITIIHSIKKVEFSLYVLILGRRRKKGNIFKHNKILASFHERKILKQF